MSGSPDILYQLLEGTMDKGLPFAASYLEGILKCPVVITDYLGYVHYPTMHDTDTSIDSLYVNIPENLNEGEYSYDETDGCLYYLIGQKEERACIIVKSLSKDMLTQAITTISDAELAIKVYFKNLARIRQNTAIFERKIAEYLFFQSHLNIRDIIKMSGKTLDIDKPYYISIARIDEADREIDLRLIGSYSDEYLKRENIDIIPIEWPNCLMSIIPAKFKEDTLEIDPEWPRLEDHMKWKEKIESRFNCVISTSLGRPYLLKALHKSYNEARIALTIPRLLGRKGFIQRFSDLGVFSLIFSQDMEEVKKYCLQTLGRLIEYDNKNNTELLPTLRCLANNGFNRKCTADKLFIHINTMHYRVEKIEQILGTDLSRMETRFNLFSAVTVWDTLRAIGFLD